MWFWILLVTVVGLLYLYFEKVYSYWKGRNVPTEPYYYGAGNLWETLIMRKNVGMIITELYNKYKGYNYVGYYSYTTPVLLVRDPELVKDMLIKDFNSFHDNDMPFASGDDDLFAENPFMKKGEEWKRVRGQLTPSFTSGKMKEMFPLIKENCKKLERYIDRHNGVAIEAKELASRFTGENVASCAFGLEGKCLEKDDAEFYQIGKSILEPSIANAIKGTLIFFLPSIARLFNLRFLNQQQEHFFVSIVDQTLEWRKTNNVRRGDFLDNMLDLKSKINDEKSFNNRTILSHAVGFFGDGFETSAVVISFALYELAANVHVQEKLRAEIRTVLAKHNGEINYEALQEMEYLDCVIKENLRKNSPVYNLHKLCTQRYKLPPAKESDLSSGDVYIEPGTSVVIPTHGLHLDEQYHPDPLVFRPERFGKAENDSIVKGSYIPFGEGPRMCLGNKFGLLQSKMGIATIIARYKIDVDVKTKEPLQLAPQAFMLAVIGGTWLKYTKLS